MPKKDTPIKKKGKGKGQKRKEKYESDSGSDSDSDPKSENPISPNEDPLVIFTRLLLKCKYILKIADREAGRVRKNKQNPLETYIENYLKVIKKTTFDDHAEDILKMYEKHKRHILKDDCSWLAEKQVILTFGHGVDRPKSKAKVRVELHLSSIFGKASKLYDKYEKDVQNGKKGKCEEYVKLETIILYYLYSLFETVADDGDELETLGELIDKVSEVLGVTDGTFKDTFDFANGISGLFNGDIRGTFGKLFEIVLASAESNGMELPPGLKQGNFEKLFKVFDSFIGGKDDGNVSGVLMDIMSSIKDCDNYSDMIKLLMNRMKDPEILKQASEHFGIDLNEDEIAEALNNEEAADKVGQLISDGMKSLGIDGMVKDKIKSVAKSVAEKMPVPTSADDFEE